MKLSPEAAGCGSRGVPGLVLARWWVRLCPGPPGRWGQALGQLAAGQGWPTSGCDWLLGLGGCGTGANQLVGG